MQPQQPKTQKQQPFIATFLACTLDPHLSFADYTQHSQKYFITNIKLIQNNQQQLYNHYNDTRKQIIKLSQQYCLLIERNQEKQPICDIINCQHHQVYQQPKWNKIIEGDFIKEQEVRTTFYYRCGFGEGFVYDVEIFDAVEEDKGEEVTMPSLTQKSQISQSYFKIQIGNMVKYINFMKKSQIQVEKLRFKPQTKALFQRLRGQFDIPNLAILCFPQGVKIFKKQTGFKFFSFILTTDSAERFYCNSIVFSQKCSNQLSIKLKQKYGIQTQKGIFCQKIFTIICQYSCTQHINKCLQHIYRLYLTNTSTSFTQKLHTFIQQFTINPQTNRCQLKLPNLTTFKLNTSYPHTSPIAIYSIFKFLHVQNIITVLQNILLERKVFLISECNNLIGMAIQAFLSFIYPLNWIHGIINPLAYSMIDYTQAPMTIIFGASNTIAEKILNKDQVQGLFVFLDSNKIVFKKCQELRFSYHLRKQLIQRLKQFSVYDYIDVRDYLNNTENLALFKTQKTQDPNFDCYKIRNIFFELTVFMLRNYKDYFLKTKKNLIHHQKSVGLKKYYDIKSLQHLYRKDPFMQAFIHTSLFSVLIEKKKQQPYNKWIKMLDKAIRKINSYKKQYIAEQSDNHQDNQSKLVQQEEGQYVPKGCLNMISMISKQSKESDEDKMSRSNPSPKNITKVYEQQNYQSPSKNIGRLSLPNQYQKRQNQSSVDNTHNLKHRDSNHSNYSSPQNNNKNSISSNTSQKYEKQTQKGSQSCDKSSTGTPQLIQNHQTIVYQFDIQNQQPKQGMAYLICNIFSLPYRKMSNSVVSRWTRKKINKIKSWKNKQNIKKQNQGVVVKMVEQQAPNQQQQQQQKQSMLKKQKYQQKQTNKKQQINMNH